MKKLLLVTLCAAFLPAAIAFAQSDPLHARTITVSGEASEETAPDQAVVSVSLVSEDTDLKRAKQHNDDMVGRLVAIARQFNIPKANLATSNVSIAPQYDEESGKQRFTGYSVSRSLRITLDSIDLHEKLLTAIVEAKIDQVNGIEFRLAKPEEHAGALRVKAFENARARAEALAQAAGGKLGPALSIATDDVSSIQPRPMPMMAMARAEAPSVAPSLPGMIELHEAVTVVFGLE